MSIPTPSKLDHQQVLQAVLDEATGRLRVDALLTSTIIPPPGLEVSINSVDDNIAIRNSSNSNELLINNDGSINVNAAVTLAPNSSINLNQIDGSPTSISNGTADSGTLRVAIASDNNPLAVTQSTNPWVISGLINLTKTNREQLFGADDLVQTITWSDFGTNDERIATIVLTSSSLSLTATQTFNYTFTSGAYRLDTAPWT